MTGMPKKFSYEDIADRNLVPDLMRNGDDNGWYEITLVDDVVSLPAREAIMNLLIWRIHIMLDMDITADQVFDIPNFTGDTLSDIHTKIYDIACEKYHVDQELALSALWFNVNDVYNFTIRWCDKYLSSTSLMKHIRIWNHPEVQKIIDIPFKPELGTKAAEDLLARKSKLFLDLVKTPGRLEYNPLLPLLRAGAVKENQVVALFIALCARSDIDNKMQRHIIETGILEGIQSEKDFATEALSAKKAGFFNRVVITDSQYFGRRLRLLMTIFHTFYEGTCGSDVPMPITHVIREGTGKNYIDKVVVVDDEYIPITKDNYTEFEGETHQLTSVHGCAFKDGFCEACMTRRKAKPFRFFPKNIKIGIFAATKLVSVISQSILSSKHFNSTATEIFHLNDKAQKFMWVGKRNIRLVDKITERMDDLVLRLTADQVDYLGDLLEEDELPRAEMFSEIRNLGFVRGDKVIPVTLVKKTEKVVPFLSRVFLRYIKEHYEDARTDNKFIYIPMKDFDPNHPILSFNLMNNDMHTFSGKVESFFAKDISRCKTVEDAMQKLCDLLYSKISVNFHYLEIIVRAFMQTGPDDYNVPHITSGDERVMFGRLGTLIPERSISANLGYERHKQHLSKASTYVHPKMPGIYDLAFGF